MTAVGIIIWGVVALVLSVPLALMASISWNTLLGWLHERRALRYLTQTVAQQQRQLMNSAKHQADVGEIQQRLELKRRQADALILERRLAEESGEAAITLNRVLADRDALQVRVDQLENENRRLGDKVEMAEEAFRESEVQINAKTEEIYRLEKILAGNRGEDLLTRSS